MHSKRILLMYISEVSGHRNAAMAVEKAFKIICPKAEILNINALNYTNPVSEKIVNSIYMSIIKRIPSVWDYLYDNSRIAKKVRKLQESVHRINAPKLRKLFDNFKPDVVVCSQAFPCSMVAAYKMRYDYSVPLVAVLTDFVPHLYWVHEGVDYYVTASAEVDKRLCSRGVPLSRIKQFGIPFDPKFSIPVDRQKVISQLGLARGKQNILVMGGGQGLGPIKAIVKSLDNIDHDFQVMVITGVNKKLYKQLLTFSKRLKKKIHLFEFVNNVNELMAISDIIVSKPGGITTAEALSLGLPMAIIKPIPGQEANNAEYLLKEKAAVKIDSPESAGKIVGDLLADSRKLKLLSDNARRISKPSASMDIAGLLLDLCGKK